MAEPRPSLPGDALFEQRNAFLDVLLGVISLAERAVSTVADLAEPAPAPPRHSGRPPPPEGPLLR
jgi:hypothetical protein